MKEFFLSLKSKGSVWSFVVFILVIILTINSIHGLYGVVGYGIIHGFDFSNQWFFISFLLFELILAGLMFYSLKRRLNTPKEEVVVSPNNNNNVTHEQQSKNFWNYYSLLLSLISIILPRILEFFYSKGKIQDAGLEGVFYIPIFFVVGIAIIVLLAVGMTNLYTVNRRTISNLNIFSTIIFIIFFIGLNILNSKF